MLSVYDMRTNGAVDPEVGPGQVLLSWRLGADGQGVDQVRYRVRVTSLADGEGVWDTLACEGSRNVVSYGGAPLEVGTSYVWFVEVVDSRGEHACSAPAAFVVGAGVPEPARNRCAGVLFCPEEGLASTFGDADLRFLGKEPWDGLLGMRLASVTRLVQRVPLRGPGLVQGSFLAERGLVVSRVTRQGSSVVLEMSLPPGMEGDVYVGDETYHLVSGRHRIEVPFAP